MTEQEKIDKLYELKLRILSKLVRPFPAPKDENGQHILLVQNGKGEIVQWPKGLGGQDMTIDELEVWQEATK